MSYNLFKFVIIKNEHNYIKKFDSTSQALTNTIQFFKIKSQTNNKDIFFVLSLIHKIFMKKGFLIKIIKSINYSLIKINDLFFNSFLAYYINNENFCYFNESLDLSNGISEIFMFKSLNTFCKDIFPIFTDELNKKTICSADDSFNDFTSINQNFRQKAADDINANDEIFELNDIFEQDNMYSSLFMLSYFKYFYFFSFFKSNFFLPSNQLYSNYLMFLYSKDIKKMSLSFFNKYFLLLLNNYYKFHFKNYINISNNFFSITYFLPKFFSYMNFFFKVQLKTLNKKMKKILKNRKKYNTVYSYIKPHRRINVAIYFFKKYISIADGKTNYDKILNVFLSLLLEDKSS